MTSAVVKSATSLNANEAAISVRSAIPPDTLRSYQDRHGVILSLQDEDENHVVVKLSSEAFGARLSLAVSLPRDALQALLSEPSA